MFRIGHNLVNEGASMLGYDPKERISERIKYKVVTRKHYFFTSQSFEDPEKLIVSLGNSNPAE